MKTVIRAESNLDGSELPPMCWPENCKSPLGRVLNGIPFIGPDRRAFKMFRKLIRLRPENCTNYWPNDPTISEIRDRLIEIIASDMDWRCNKFLPGDPCDILFQEEPLEFASGVCICRIEDEFSLTLPIEDLDKWTLLQLVTYIGDHRREAASMLR